MFRREDFRTVEFAAARILVLQVDFSHKSNLSPFARCVTSAAIVVGADIPENQETELDFEGNNAVKLLSFNYTDFISLSDFQINNNKYDNNNINRSLSKNEDYAMNSKPKFYDNNGEKVYNVAKKYKFINADNQKCVFVDSDLINGKSLFFVKSYQLKK